MNMENFDEVIFDDDEFLETEQEPQNPEGVQDKTDNTTTEEPSGEVEDITNEVLRLKGISDPEKIKFEDESGAVVERPWDSLSREEQINILTTQESVEDTLDDQEIELLNAIRNSGMSVQDYMNKLQTPKPTPKEYKVDALSDEDVYALDILEKVGSDNISDEELTNAVNEAKKNENLFQKTVEGLRNEYKRLQEDEEAQQANEEAAKQEAAYNQFASSIINEIRGLNSFAGNDLELSNEDMEDLSAFMLDLDESGTSAFGRALQNPTLFTEAAFWTLNKNEIIGELTKQMQDNYKRGYEAAKKDFGGSSKVVINTPKTSKSKANLDEFVDDDEW